MLVTASLESRSTGHTVVLQAFTIVSLRVVCRPAQRVALEEAPRDICRAFRAQEAPALRKWYLIEQLLAGQVLHQAVLKVSSLAEQVLPAQALHQPALCVLSLTEQLLPAQALHQPAL